MPESIKLCESYTPHLSDIAVNISTQLLHILGYFRDNPGELLQCALRDIESDGKDPDIYTLKASNLLGDAGPINGLVTTDLGCYVLEQVLNSEDLRGNVLIVNTYPYSELLINRPRVRAIRKDAYDKALEAK